MPAFAHELITGNSFLLGVISGNENPPGGLPETNPGFSETQIPIFVFLGNISEKNRLVRYRRINNKGVLERPGTKWKVLKTISSTYIEIPIFPKS